MVITFFYGNASFKEVKAFCVSSLITKTASRTLSFLAALIVSQLALQYVCAYNVSRSANLNKKKNKQG